MIPFEVQVEWPLVLITLAERRHPEQDRNLVPAAPHRFRFDLVSGHISARRNQDIRPPETVYAAVPAAMQSQCSSPFCPMCSIKGNALSFEIELCLPPSATPVKWTSAPSCVAGWVGVVLSEAGVPEWMKAKNAGRPNLTDVLIGITLLFPKWRGDGWGIASADSASICRTMLPVLGKDFGFPSREEAIRHRRSARAAARAVQLRPTPTINTVPVRRPYRRGGYNAPAEKKSPLETDVDEATWLLCNGRRSCTGTFLPTDPSGEVDKSLSTHDMLHAMVSVFSETAPRLSLAYGQAVLERVPSSTEAKLLLARVYQSKENYLTAIVHLDKAIGEGP